MHDEANACSKFKLLIPLTALSNKNGPINALFEMPHHATAFRSYRWMVLLRNIVNLHSKWNYVV